MKRILSIILAFIFVLSFTACGSGGSQKAGSNWTPVVEYDDFGEAVGYADRLEYKTTATIIKDGERTGEGRTVDFSYNKQISTFGIGIDADNIGGHNLIDDLSYKIDGKSYTIDGLDNYGFGGESDQDFERVYEALIDGKDITFSAYIIGGHYVDSQNYVFTISGNGFEDAVNEYLK